MYIEISVHVMIKLLRRADFVGGEGRRFDVLAVEILNSDRLWPSFSFLSFCEGGDVTGVQL